MTKEYFLGGLTISDLETLQEIKLEPGNNWTLIVGQHSVKEEFTSGLLGKNGFQLLEVFAKIYSKLNKVHPPNKVSVKNEEDGSTMEYDLPFYGDHCFLETMKIDFDNKVIELGFGS
jgi:hypothetical protein